MSVNPLQNINKWNDWLEILGAIISSVKQNVIEETKYIVEWIKEEWYNIIKSAKDSLEASQSIKDWLEKKISRKADAIHSHEQYETTEIVDKKISSLKKYVDNWFSLSWHEHEQYSLVWHEHEQYSLIWHEHEQYATKDDLTWKANIIHYHDEYATKDDLRKIELTPWNDWLSAYQIAVKNWFKWSELDWLASLRWKEWLPWRDWKTIEVTTRSLKAHKHSYLDIEGLWEYIQDTIWTKLVEWSNITITYDDVSWETTISSTWWGVSDHWALSWLLDDDHTQYHNDSRWDARYYTKTLLNWGQLDSRYYTEAETDTLLSWKANVSHTHTASQISDFDTEVSNNTDVLANTTARHTHANQSILNATTASFTTADETKLDYITVTQAVDLDAIEARVNDLDASVILKWTWDASVGSFPWWGTAQAWWSYIVSVAGTVNGVSFAVNDRIIAIVDNASTTTFASNWFKADYTDQVLSVNGQTGAVTLAKWDVWLWNVDNTSDLNKPISTATQTALDNKQPLDSQLTDLAWSSYTWNSLKVIRVNAWETWFELATPWSWGTPWWSDQEFQFNDGWSFGGIPEIKWDKTTKYLSCLSTGSSAWWEFFTDYLTNSSYFFVNNNTIELSTTWNLLFTWEQISFRDNSASFSGFFNLSWLNTANRTYTFPDANGTIALTSDIPSFTPPWGDGNIIFNDSGAYGAISQFNWDATNSELNLDITDDTWWAGLFSVYIHNIDEDVYGALSIDRSSIYMTTTWTLTLEASWLIINAGDSPEFRSTDYIYKLQWTSWFANLTLSWLTTNRTFTFPDASWTIALTSDLSSYQPLDSDLTNLAIRWTAASASWPASLQFHEDTDNGTNKITVQAPATLSADYTLTLPTDDGTSWQLLQTDGSGVTSWATIAWWDTTNNIWYLNIPHNTQSAAYTLVLGDSWKCIDHPASDATGRTYTIPANSSVAYPIGTAITFSNMSVGNVTIAINTDTLYNSSWSTWSRTLAQYWTATAVKKTSTTWLITGTNLT